MKALVGEAKTAARALVASTIATAVDGVIYNAVLFVSEGRYAVAAALGAVIGAVTNFLICRYWVFPPTMKRIDYQALQYLVGSVLTYLALQGTLILLIEGFHVDAHLAWFPAKGVAFGLVSYPFSRLVAFSRLR